MHWLPRWVQQVVRSWHTDPELNPAQATAAVARDLDAGLAPCLPAVLPRLAAALGAGGDAQRLAAAGLAMQARTHAQALVSRSYRESV